MSLDAEGEIGRAPGLQAALASLRPDAGAASRLRDFPRWDIRHVSAVERVHYSVSRAQDCRTPPGTCLVETKDDEILAREVGKNGIETLPEEFLGRFETLAAVAEYYGARMDLQFDDIRDAVMALIESESRS